MTAADKPRRAYTLLKAGRGQPSRPMVERRPLFSYWAILMPHFRGVLLPPQNRADECIQWTWTEPAVADAVSAAELATIRKRLTVAQQSLADSIEDTAEAAAKAATMQATRERMDEIVNALVALPDTALAGFVARTERGMLLHSWGLASAPPVQYLDVDFELAGRVLVAGASASGHTVLLETVDGARVAQTSADAEGRFEFPKVAAGSYRVRAVSRTPDVVFPEKGEVIELVTSSITTLEIRSEERKKKPVAPLPEVPSGRRVRGVVLISAAILAVAVYYFWPSRSAVPVSSGMGEQSGGAVNIAPRSVAPHGEGNAEEEGRRAAQGATDVTAVKPTVLKTTKIPKSPDEALPPRKGSLSKDIIVAQQTSALPGEQTGAPVGNGGITGGSRGSGTGGSAGGAQAGGRSTSSGAGNAGGSPGAGSGAGATSGRPASSPVASSSQVAAVAGPGGPPPSGGRPSGSPAPEVAPPSASASKEQARLARPPDRTAEPVSELAETKPATVDAPRQPGAETNKEPADPVPDARTPASELADSAEPVPDETGDKSERPSAEISSREGNTAPSVSSEESKATQVGAVMRDRDPSLAVRMALRSSPWRRLLLRDAIVPTLPTRIGQDDDLRDLGARVLAEKQAAVPRTLQDGRVVLGVRVEFSTPSDGAPPHWELADGGAAVVANADKGAAEIAWLEGAPAAHYFLVAADGQRLVQVSVDPQKGVRVSSAGGISSWPWVGIECAPGESGRFGWQILGTASVPTTWRESKPWLNSHGWRLDLRQLAEKDETVVLTLAIIDASTGWALTSKVEYQQMLPR